MAVLDVWLIEVVARGTLLNPTYALTAAVFRLFDVDGDGFVTVEDLAKLLDLLVGQSISPQTREEIIRRTIAEADEDRDGRISYDDFSLVRGRAPSTLSLALGRDATDL